MGSSRHAQKAARAMLARRLAQASSGSDLPRLPRLGNGADLAHQAQVILFGP
jgi:hypothetical protein